MRGLTEPAGAVGTGRLVGERRLFVPDDGRLGPHARRVLEELDPAEALERDEPEHGGLDRPAGGEEAVLADEDEHRPKVETWRDVRCGGYRPSSCRGRLDDGIRPDPSLVGREISSLAMLRPSSSARTTPPKSL